jgi:hypothetical protein
MNVEEYKKVFSDKIRKVEPIVSVNTDPEVKKKDPKLNRGKKSTLAHSDYVPVEHKKPLIDRMA